MKRPRKQSKRPPRRRFNVNSMRQSYADGVDEGAAREPSPMAPRPATEGPGAPRELGENPSMPKRTYHYIKSKSDDGQMALMGPYNTEQEAYDIGYQRLDGQFVVVAYPTADMARATQMMKHGRLQKDGATLGEALQKIKHKF